MLANVGGGGDAWGMEPILNRKFDSTLSIVFSKCDQNGQILYVHTTESRLTVGLFPRAFVA